MGGFFDLMRKHAAETERINFIRGVIDVRELRVIDIRPKLRPLLPDIGRAWLGGVEITHPLRESGSVIRRGYEMTGARVVPVGTRRPPSPHQNRSAVLKRNTDDLGRGARGGPQHITNGTGTQRQWRHAGRRSTSSSQHRKPGILDAPDDRPTLSAVPRVAHHTVVEGIGAA